MSENLTREYFRKQGRRGGKLGSKARMEKLTPEERSEIARKAGKNRWKSRNGTDPAALSDPSTTAETVQPKKGKAKK